MSWITNNQQLAIGPNAADLLAEVVKGLKEGYMDNGKGLKPVLEELLAEQGIPTDKQSLLEILRAKLEENDKDELLKLLSSLSDLERLDEESARTLAALGREWRHDKTAGADTQFNLDVSASGKVSFIVDKDGTGRPQDVPPLEQRLAAAKLLVHGKLTGAAKGSQAIDALQLGGSFNAHLERKLTYYFSYPSGDILAGLALSGALRRLRAPYELDSVLKGFHGDGTGELDAIRLFGSAGLAADAKLGASVTTPQGAKLGLSLTGHVNLGREFETVITSSRPGTVKTTVRVGRSAEQSSEIGVSASVGLSSLAPSVPARLLDQTSKASDFIDAFEKKLDTLPNSSWLKPGTLLQDKITDSIQALVDDADEGDLVKRGLARLFGLDEGAGFDEAVTGLIVEKTTGLLSGLVDDTLGIYAGNTEELEIRLVETIEGKVGGKIREKLKIAVFDELPALDKLLKDKAKNLNKKTKTALETALGRSVEDTVEAIREVIEDARGLLSRIIEGVNVSINELVAIEFSYSREKARQLNQDFSLTFSQQSAREFTRVILSPGRFGGYLFNSGGNLPAGVTLSSYLSNSLITHSRGSQFGLALASITLTGGNALSSNVEVIRTETGIAAGSKATLREYRRLLGESRQITFISAHAIAETQLLTGPGDLRGELERLPAKAPSITPRLSLHFEESDGKLWAKEIRKLFSRMLDFGAMDQDSLAGLLQAFHEIAGDEEYISATVSVSLAIPPAEIATLIGYGADQPAELKEVMSALFIAHLKDEIEEAFELPFTDRFQREVGISGEVNLRELLGKLDDLVVAADDHFTRVLNRPFKAGRERYSKQEIMAGLRNIQSSLNMFHRVFTLAKKILNADLSMPNDELQEFLKASQEAMAEEIKPFLKSGIPVPGWVPIGGKMPARSVVLFLALQRIAKLALGITPPLVIQLAPEGQKTRTFQAISMAG